MPFEYIIRFLTIIIIKQCVQIGHFLKVFWDNFSYKSSQNIWQLFENFPF